jgi:GNAT superfamily N-acetyltransferase
MKGKESHQSRNMVVEIVRGDFAAPDAQALIQQLDIYLSVQYPDYVPELYGVTVEDLRQARSGFWFAYWHEDPVGCVAIRPYRPTIAELKRMYVMPQFRNRGIGSQLLRTAEAAAIAWGYEQICLETGDRQSESLRLYERFGYQPIPCFGKYTDPESLCYLKSLTNNPSTVL